jgi:hypothetical protein
VAPLHPNESALTPLFQIRWSQPDDPQWSPGGHGPRGQWMRLFACTALVRLAPKCPEPFEGECETLARLISSAIELGQPVARAAAGLLALRFWHIRDMAKIAHFSPLLFCCSPRWKAEKTAGNG